MIYTSFKKRKASSGPDLESNKGEKRQKQQHTGSNNNNKPIVNDADETSSTHKSYSTVNGLLHSALNQKATLTSAKEKSDQWPSKSEVQMSALSRGDTATKSSAVTAKNNLESQTSKSLYSVLSQLSQYEDFTSQSDLSPCAYSEQSRIALHDESNFSQYINGTLQFCPRDSIKRAWHRNQHDLKHLSISLEAFEDCLLPFFANITFWGISPRDDSIFAKTLQPDNFIVFINMYQNPHLRVLMNTNWFPQNAPVVGKQISTLLCSNVKIVLDYCSTDSRVTFEQFKMSGLYYGAYFYNVEKNLLETQFFQSTVQSLSLP